MAELEPPRFVDGKPMLIAGIAKQYNRNEMVTAITGITLQWQRYKRSRAPDFERYGEEFDARSNSGYVDIWIPVES